MVSKNLFNQDPRAFSPMPGARRQAADNNKLYWPVTGKAKWPAGKHPEGRLIYL